MLANPLGWFEITIVGELFEAYMQQAESRSASSLLLSTVPSLW